MKGNRLYFHRLTQFRISALTVSQSIPEIKGSHR